MPENSHISDNLASRTDDVDTSAIKGFGRYIIPGIALSWASFQLALAGYFVLDSTKTRAIHLAFAITLLFFTTPFS